MDREAGTHWHHRVENAILTLLTGSLVLLAFAQILARNLFGVSFIWADPVIRHLVLWASFAGAVVAGREGRHLRIDAFLRLLPHRPRLCVETLGHLISCAFCGLLTWVAVRFVLDERAYGMVEDVGLPSWQLQLIFPLTFAALTLQFGRRVIDQLRKLKPFRQP